jgi:predicted DNA-binding transcriptional regulator AlpA
MAPEPLAGISEIAALLNVSKNTAVRYTNRPDFPAPVGTLAAGRIWREADVRKWAHKTLPLPPGRPHRS